MFYRLCNHLNYGYERDLNMNMLSEKFANNFAIFRPHDQTTFSVNRTSYDNIFRPHIQPMKPVKINLCDVMLNESIPTAVNILK